MKIALKIFIVLISTAGFCQSQVSGFEKDLYDRAISRIDALDYLEIQKGLKSNSPEVVNYVTEIKEKLTKESLELFQEIFDTLPKTKFLNKINYELGGMYTRQGESKIASEYYIRVLSNSEPINLTNEREDNYTRNNVCIWLAEIFIENKDYENALKYLDESKKYKVSFFCGNAIIEYHERLRKLYSICRDGKAKN